MTTPAPIVIVGAGPAGLTLAYLLVSNGRAVRVLERHPDFEREFRGELVQPSSLRALAPLGVLDRLVREGLAVPDVERRMFVGLRREVMRAVRTKGERGMIVSQPAYLRLLHEECSRYPGYQLDFGTSVTEAVREGDRVVAVKTRRGAAEGRVEGGVFVVCSGRNSVVRKSAGVEVESFEQPADALWLRFDLSDAPAALPRGVDVHMFGAGVVVVFQPTTRSRLQVAYSAPGDLGKLRKDVPELKRRLLPTVPEALRPLLDRKLDDATEWQILRIAVDRLKRWYVPGMLFLGDAAHTMSPSGGQGLNVAIRDAVVTANHFLDAPTLDTTVFQRIQDERTPEIEAAQAGQIRAGRMVMKPAFVLHFAFTLIGFLVGLFIGRKPAAADPLTVKHPVRIHEA